jgi:hypothetical protein
MRFSIVAIVIALTASMSVNSLNTCYPEGHSCELDTDCCLLPCNVSMNDCFVSAINLMTHHIIVQHLQEPLSLLGWYVMNPE